MRFLKVRFLWLDTCTSNVYSSLMFSFGGSSSSKGPAGPTVEEGPFAPLPGTSGITEDAVPNAEQQSRKQRRRSEPLLPLVPGTEERKTAETKFRKTIGNLFLTSDLTAASTVTVSHDAVQAGACGVEDLGKGYREGEDMKNANRDTTRRLLKHSMWPPLFYDYIDVRDPKTENVRRVRWPFLLPHEWLLKLRQLGADLSLLKPCALHNQEAFAHCLSLSRSLKCEASDFIALGLHGDGVPFGAAGDSLEIYTINFPTSRAEDGLHVRVPITCVQKRFMAKGHTVHSIMEIIAWSLRMCALGVQPSCRLDGSSFEHAADRIRRKNKSKESPRACLIQIRGDWAFFKTSFDFPGWSDSQGLCWFCTCTPATMRNALQGCDWRKPENRLSSNSFMVRLRARCTRVPPLLQVPGVTAHMWLPDWLHSGDQGAAADAIGSFFDLLTAQHPQGKFLGESKKSRVCQLWARILEYYAETKADKKSKLQELTPQMIKASGKPPKLRCKAAMVRHLVPFVQTLATEMLSNSSEDQCVLQFITALRDCYKWGVEQYDQEKLAAASRRFTACWVVLEKYELHQRPGSMRWRVKPKSHMFAELCEFVCLQHGPPRSFWCYRDEDFGGWLTRVAERQGGPNTGSATAARALQRFCAFHQLIQIAKSPA